MIRLIATDLDGTLLDNQSALSARTVRAVSQAMEVGAKFVIATGRMTESTRRFAEKLSTNAPIIAFNGALAMDWRTGNALFQRTIAPEIARAVAAMAERRDVFIQYFPGDGFFYARRVAEICDEYEGRLRIRGTETIVALSEWIERPAFKFLALGAHEKLLDLKAEVMARFPQLAAMLSHPTYLEIVVRGVDKGAALEALANLYGIAREEVLAFGDADNDAEMLRYAGHGYAMANGSDAALAASGRLAPPNDEDGVARVLESLLAQNKIGG